MKKIAKNEEWKLYEETILQHFREVYPDCKVEGNQKIDGVQSKRKRQIDILITNQMAGFPIKIVIDCKHFSTKIDVKIVEAFIGMLSDVKASKGVIITNLGYTKSAIERAKFSSRDIQLDILEFEDLPQFSGVADAFPSRWNDREQMALVFSCPFGWKIHETPMKGYSAGLTKDKLTWQEGIESKEFIYMSLVSKSEFPKIENLYEYQDEQSKLNYPGVQFDYYCDLDERFENHFCEKVILRVCYYPQYPEVDYTLFIDFGTFLTYFALVTPRKNVEQNLKKLAFIGRSVVPYDLPKKGKPIPIEWMKFFFSPKNLFQNQNMPAKDI